MSFWRYVLHGPWLPILLAAIVGTLTRRETRQWLLTRRTDWNDIRERMGYEAQSDRPVRPLPEPPRQWLLGIWPQRVNWDRVRHEYGYGVTVEGQYRVVSDQLPQRSRN